MGEVCDVWLRDKGRFTSHSPATATPTPTKRMRCVFSIHNKPAGYTFGHLQQMMEKNTFSHSFSLLAIGFDCELWFAEYQPRKDNALNEQRPDYLAVWRIRFELHCTHYTSHTTSHCEIYYEKALK